MAVVTSAGTVAIEATVAMADMALQFPVTVIVMRSPITGTAIMPTIPDTNPAIACASIMAGQGNTAAIIDSGER